MYGTVISGKCLRGLGICVWFYPKKLMMMKTREVKHVTNVQTIILTGTDDELVNNTINQIIQHSDN